MSFYLSFSVIAYCVFGVCVLCTVRVCTVYCTCTCILADRTNGRAYATVLRQSSSVVVCLCRLYWMYCG